MSTASFTCRKKVAVTSRSRSTRRSHGPPPEHAPPQPENLAPASGRAERVTTVPSANEAEQVPPQSMPDSDESTAPGPVLVTLTAWAGGGAPPVPPPPFPPPGAAGPPSAAGPASPAVPASAPGDAPPPGVPASTAGDPTPALPRVSIWPHAASAAASTQAAGRAIERARMMPPRVAITRPARGERGHSPGRAGGRAPRRLLVRVL